jgi:hypothetical protein
MTATLDARVAAIVARTTRAQGLSLAVTDPAALHTIATLVLAAGTDQPDNQQQPA